MSDTRDDMKPSFVVLWRGEDLLGWGGSLVVEVGRGIVQVKHSVGSASFRNSFRIRNQFNLVVLAMPARSA